MIRFTELPKQSDFANQPHQLQKIMNHHRCRELFVDRRGNVDFVSKDSSDDGRLDFVSVVS